MRLEHDVGKDLQGWNQVATECRRGQAGVQGLGALEWLTPRLSSAVSNSRLSRDPAGPRVIHSATIVAAPPDVHTVCDLVSRPGGDQQRERRRLDPRHDFANEHQPIGILMLFDRRRRCIGHDDPRK